MASLTTTATALKEQYLPLIKGRQTFLLALTGAAGYLCQPPAAAGWLQFTGLVGSLLATISGCTVLNMLFDRDIDEKMERTRHRPLAQGRVDGLTAGWLGGGLLVSGLLWAAWLSISYFMVILAGACLNLLVYTVWLKRRSAWSILWGGVAGGMPILAGRVLARGEMDLPGVLLALVIVCWIPSHNLTLGMLYSTDYRRAGIPTIPGTYGAAATHFLVALSSLLVSIIMLLVFIQLGLQGFILGLFIMLSVGLVSLATLCWVRPARKLLTVVYKFSSIYLLVSTLLLLFSGMV
jgi:protoheme IX farnesyltransferase